MRERRREEELVAEDVVVGPERHLDQPHERKEHQQQQGDRAGIAELASVAPEPMARRGATARTRLTGWSVCFCIRRPGQPIDDPAQHEDRRHHQRGDGAAVAPQEKVKA